MAFDGIGRRHFLRRTAAGVGGLSLLDVAAHLLAQAPAGVNPTNDPKSSAQRYLNAAPVGIDARWAWTRTNGAGDGVGFVDIEAGWFIAVDAASAGLQHEDLPRVGDGLRISPGTPHTMPTSTCSQSRHHGSAVVGIVAGRDNTLGIVGAAPRATTEVVSHLDSSGNPGNVKAAIESVLTHMTAGDILLIEYQGPGNDPAEMDANTYDAIAAAIMAGMIVIEPAGNANINLNNVNRLNPAHPQFRDSGAVIVGACNEPDSVGNGRTRWVTTLPDFPPPPPFPPFLPNCNPPGPPPFFPGSNFGDRVDCYAWGEGIVSTGYGWDGGTTGTNSYTNRFGGTSGAAAIVAAAAVVIQGLHKYVHNRPLTASEMRNVLRATGTPQQPPGATEKIGVMPNIRGVADALGLSQGSTVPSAPTGVRIIP